MVLKVMPCTPSAKNPLDYNVNKVENGDATLVGVRNIPSAEYSDICRTLLYRESLAINTKKPSIHFTLSADKGEGEFLADNQALELIDKEMNAVDMGDQPYVVFRHEDTDKTHYHVVSVKVLPDGRSVLWNGIGKRLIHELMKHEIEYGYVAGRNLHEVKLRRGEGVYQTIHDKFEKIMKEGNYCSYKEFRACARNCHIEVRRRQSKFVDRKILIVNRLGEDGKRIGRPIYLTGNEAEQVRDVIAKNYQGLMTIYKEEFIPMTEGNVSLISVRQNIYDLMMAAKAAGRVVTEKCNAKYNELKSTWNKFLRLNQERAEAKDRAGNASAIIGMLALLNPIIALTVMLLAKISNDLAQTAAVEKRKQLLSRVESIRGEIRQLEKRKEQLRIENQELLKEYLDTNQMFKEYQESLNAIDHNIIAIKADIEKSSKMERIMRFVKTPKAQDLLNYINSAFDTFEGHEHLVPGPLVQTANGMRWELYSDGYISGEEIYGPHSPAPVKYGMCYIDFYYTEHGQLIATVEADKNNYYTKGVSGTLNIDTGVGEVKERTYFGTKEEHDRKIALEKAKAESNTTKRPVRIKTKGLKR